MQVRLRLNFTKYLPQLNIARMPYFKEYSREQLDESNFLLVLGGGGFILPAPE